MRPNNLCGLPHWYVEGWRMAGTVWIITGSVVFAAIELVAHWWIAKCENWTGIHTDQALHYLCKAFYVLLAP